MAPGDKFVRAAFSEAQNEVDAAINQTVTALFKDNSPKHHGDLFRIVRFPTGMCVSRNDIITVRNNHESNNYVKNRSGTRARSSVRDL